MIIHAIGGVLLLITLIAFQAMAFKAPSYALRTILRLLALALCIFCSATYMFAFYTQTKLDQHADRIWSLPEECFDNELVVTLESAKFMAKDRLEISLTFEPDGRNYGSEQPPTVEHAHFEFLSPNIASGYSKAPMLALGLILWVITFVFGWVLKSVFDVIPKQMTPSQT